MSLALVRRDPPTREKSMDIVRRDASRLPWVWDGLCFAVAFNDPTQDSARDVVTNAAPSTVVGLAWAKDPRGNAVANLGASSYLEYADNPQHNRPTTEFTAYVRFRRAGTPEAAGGLLCKRYASGEPWVTWAIQDSDLGDGCIGSQITVNGTWYFWTNFDHPVTTTEWLSVFLRWRTGSNPVQDILGERGQTISTNFYAGGVSGTLSYAANQPMLINALNDVTGKNFNADYTQAMVWNRRLNNAELQALVADPFGWYSPRRQTVGVSGPFPVIVATSWRVVGYAMFATTGERDAMQAEVQAWLDAHPGGRVTASAHTVNVGGSPYALAAGQTTPALMDSAEPPTGPHPGLTWSYAVASKELRDSFGALAGGSAWAAALEGSQLGEVTT